MKDFGPIPSEENLKEKLFPVKISIPKVSMHVKIE